MVKVTGRHINEVAKKVQQAIKFSILDVINKNAVCFGGHSLAISNENTLFFFRSQVESKR